jgi:3-dehydroquinate dehydratase I
MAQQAFTHNPLASTRPLTVGILSAPEIFQQWCALPHAEQEATCDLIELRLDTLGLKAEEIRAALGQKSPQLPVLLTARHPAEGGQGPADAAARCALLRPLLDVAALIDVELRSALEMKSLILEAQQQHGVRVVGSFHDFQATPADEVLRGAIQFGQNAGLDSVKIATQLNSPADLTRLIQLTAETHRLRLSTMGMGQLGRISRLVLAKCGSLLNYGYLGESNAPGQWPAPVLKQRLAEL